MKFKNLLLFFLLGFMFPTFSVRAQTTAIPDVVFEQILIDLGHDSGVPDGVVLTANIESLVELNVSSFVTTDTIKDLTGIEDFKALTLLDCSANHLSRLDVSQNSLLEVLICARNQITNLDVSKNLLLEELWCAENLLSNLDVSQNPLLTSLFCGENPMTSLNLNTAIKNLSAQVTELRDLEVSKCLELTWVQLDENFLTSIDVSKNKELSTLSLRQNQISYLDISQNPKLDFLSVTENKLSSLDVSQNPDLTFLLCEDNQLTCLNVKNGNNTNIGASKFSTLNNFNLNCIEVDDATWSMANWSQIDPGTGFSENCNLSCTTGTFHPEFKDLRIYPNPGPGHYDVELGELKTGVRAIVINHLGQEVYFEDFGTTDRFEFGIPDGLGLYFLLLESGDGTFGVRKVVKK